MFDHLRRVVALISGMSAECATTLNAPSDLVVRSDTGEVLHRGDTGGLRPHGKGAVDLDQLGSLRVRFSQHAPPACSSETGVGTEEKLRIFVSNDCKATKNDGRLCFQSARLTDIIVAASGHERHVLLDGCILPVDPRPVDTRKAPTLVWNCDVVPPGRDGRRLVDVRVISSSSMDTEIRRTGAGWEVCRFEEPCDLNANVNYESVYEDGTTSTTNYIGGCVEQVQPLASNDQWVLDASDECVDFATRESCRTNASRTMKPAGHEWLRRFVDYGLPRGFVRPAQAATSSRTRPGATSSRRSARCSGPPPSTGRSSARCRRACARRAAAAC